MDSYRPDSDRDPQETQDWVESLESVVANEGTTRARFVLGRVMDAAQRLGAQPTLPLVTDYLNTIPSADEPAYPGDRAMERRIQHIIRWNAAVMVNNANHNYDDIGGHISTFASSATLYEVGFNHFFRGKDGGKAGDQVYYQGHAAPGIYSRAYLEGRLTPDQLEHFRRESARGKGLSSYPHPRLMSDFWEFPTVSMGLGPVNSIYQARFNRYITARGVSDASASKVWCFVGDGESDEPETLGALQIAAREKLDNLIWVVNCNLQRLDGPVWGNGKIIQSLEGAFRGAGWNVIKVIWGPGWDPIFARDTDGILRRHLNDVVDGQWQ
ncbi:MAG TPA: pyruvate dehydrogenase (acetyl-transferring), homodimeric type, partial [Polyangiaceae bacterium]|nr:pyruvate dehydrogenase (acetyl-transferring), homodimeric type [Polyangiaceae bacterium]